MKIKFTFFQSRPLAGRIAGYTLAFSLALIVFAYVRFPPDTLANMVRKNLEANGVVKMDFSSASMTFPPGLVLHQVTLSGKNGKETKAALNIDQLSLTPDIISLVTGGQSVAVKADLLGGGGIADIRRAGKENKGMQVAFELKNINPGLGPWREDSRWARFTGQMSANGSFTTPGPALSRGAGHLVITLKKGEVTPGKTLFNNLPPVQVGNGTAQLDFKAGRLSIIKCKLNGPHLNANITGEIIVASAPEFSRLNINISIKLSGALDKKLGPLLSLFPKGSAGAHIIHIGGTISNPSVH